MVIDGQIGKNYLVIIVNIKFAINVGLLNLERQKMNDKSNEMNSCFKISCGKCKSKLFEIALFPNIDTNTDGVMAICPKCQHPVFKSKMSERINDLFKLSQEEQKMMDEANIENEVQKQ